MGQGGAGRRGGKGKCGSQSGCKNNKQINTQRKLMLKKPEDYKRKKLKWGGREEKMLKNKEQNRKL